MKDGSGGGGGEGREEGIFSVQILRLEAASVRVQRPERGFQGRLSGAFRAEATCYCLGSCSLDPVGLDP